LHLVKGALEVLRRVLVVASELFLERAHVAGRGVFQAFALGVVTDDAQERAHVSLRLAASLVSQPLGTAHDGSLHERLVRARPIVSG
jgi:hypothetical protein